MSPVPEWDRLEEYGRKGVNLGLRELALAPEQVRARRLRAEARRKGSAPTGPRVLILTPRDWAVHVQWEGVIAQALRMRGAEVSFLTCGGGLELCDRVNTYEGPPMPCHTCTRYVEGSIDAHGFPRRSLLDGWRDSDRGEWPELDALALDQLFEVADHDVPLGHLIQIPVRWFLLRSSLDDEPLAAITARRLLRSARRVVDGLNEALNRVDPDVVCVLNGLFFFESIALWTCKSRGIKTFCYERGFLPGTIIAHRDDPDQLLDVSAWWDEARRRPLTESEEQRLTTYLDDRRHGRRTVDQYWTKKTRHDLEQAAHPGRLGVLFTNLTWDSAVLGQEVAFASIHDWIVAAVEWFDDHPEHRLIIRIHPAEQKLAGKQTREPLGDFIGKRFPHLPENIEVVAAADPTSSYSLMQSCDFGLVFTSTTGLELALAGKPVMVAGQTHYRGKGFTVDVGGPGEFNAALDMLVAAPEDHDPPPDLVRRYANLFFFDAPVTIPGVDEHTIGLAGLTLAGLSELAPGRDADVDRLCEFILTDS